MYKRQGHDKVDGGKSRLAHKVRDAQAIHDAVDGGEQHLSLIHISLFMQRAIRGDWVEWKPEIAPQATVMNMKLQIGVPEGCMLPKCSQISGMV